MIDWTWVTYSAWSIALAAGGVLSFFSLRSWYRDRSRPMLLLSVGVLLLSVAAAIGWIVSYGITDNPAMPSMVSAVATAAGLVVLTYAVRTRVP